MTKSNIRSIRFSDEVKDIIDAQVGDNFQQKFERLVYNAYMLLPEQEKRLAAIEKEIDEKQERLRNLKNKMYQVDLTHIQYSDALKAAIKRIENI